MGRGRSFPTLAHLTNDRRLKTFRCFRLRFAHGCVGFSLWGVWGLLHRHLRILVRRQGYIVAIHEHDFAANILAPQPPLPPPGYAGNAG